MGFSRVGRSGLLACLCVALCAAKESVEVSASGKIYAATTMKKGTSEVLCGRQQNSGLRAHTLPSCGACAATRPLYSNPSQPRNRAVPS